MPPSTQARGAGSSAPVDFKEALLRAAEAAMEESTKRGSRGRREGPPRRRSGRVTLLIGSASLLALCLYVVVVRPGWFFAPAPPPEAPEVREASMRLALVREAMLVRQFEALNGRLPGSLRESGSLMEGVEYLLHPDGTFTLSGGAGATTVTLRSSDEVTEFLGNSMAVIQNRAGK